MPAQYIAFALFSIFCYITSGLVNLSLCNVTSGIMSTITTHAAKVLELVKKAGVLRPRDLKPYGIPRTYLSRLHATGKLNRIGRGFYVLSDSSVSEPRSLAEACKMFQKG